MIFLPSADFFFPKLVIKKISFRNTIGVSNGLDPDEDRHSVGPDLGPNSLQRLSSYDKEFALIILGVLKHSRVVNFGLVGKTFYFNFFLASWDFCHQLISFANSLNPDP